MKGSMVATASTSTGWPGRLLRTAMRKVGSGPFVHTGSLKGPSAPALPRTTDALFPTGVSRSAAGRMARSGPPWAASLPPVTKPTAARPSSSDTWSALASGSRGPPTISVPSARASLSGPVRGTEKKR
jgi:hypothetical protein